MISEQNSIKKKIEELKGPREPEKSIELEQAFNRSYRISEKNTNTGNELNERETRINLIEDQTRVKTYEVTGNLNHDVSNLILKTIKPVIKMRTRVICSFSCSIFRGRNQVIQYHKTLSDNKTFTSLREIEEYIKRCELNV